MRCLIGEPAPPCLFDARKQLDTSIDCWLVNRPVFCASGCYCVERTFDDCYAKGLVGSEVRVQRKSQSETAC